jgi:hypothetical protein
MTMNRSTIDFPKEITKALLDAQVGKKVEDFCGMFGTTGDVHNHCAHFVSHVLGFRLGGLCNSMKWETRKDFESGRTIRVDDLFNNCPERGYWREKPLDLNCCLIFCTVKGNIKGGSPLVIGDQRHKHVGIFLKGIAYNYGNTKDKVRADPPSRFDNLYGKGTVTLYGTFPV